MRPRIKNTAVALALQDELSKVLSMECSEGTAAATQTRLFLCSALQLCEATFTLWLGRSAEPLLAASQLSPVRVNGVRMPNAPPCRGRDEMKESLQSSFDCVPWRQLQTLMTRAYIKGLIWGLSRCPPTESVQ